MVKWWGYCASQNTWEPKAHSPPEMIKAFITLNPDPVHMEEARERIGLVFERVNVPLQYEELIEVHHKVIQFLFSTLPPDILAKALNISDKDIKDAGLGPHKERTINANGSQSRVMQLTFCLLLSKIPSFYSDGKQAVSLFLSCFNQRGIL